MAFCITLVTVVTVTSFAINAVYGKSYLLPQQSPNDEGRIESKRTHLNIFRGDPPPRFSSNTYRSPFEEEQNRKELENDLKRLIPYSRRLYSKIPFDDEKVASIDDDRRHFDDSFWWFNGRRHGHNHQVGDDTEHVYGSVISPTVTQDIKLSPIEKILAEDTRKFLLDKDSNKFLTEEGSTNIQTEEESKNIQTEEESKNIQIEEESKNILAEEESKIFPFEGLLKNTFSEIVSKNLPPSPELKPISEKPNFPELNSINTLPKSNLPQLKEIASQPEAKDSQRNSWIESQLYGAHGPIIVPIMRDENGGQNPYVTAIMGSTMLFIILVVVVLSLRVYCLADQSAQKLEEEKWIIQQPVVLPPTPSANVQPLFTECFDPLSHLSADPVRKKAVGLLERRGSNTSLTLELSPTSQAPENTPSPPQQCTPEDFLTTAGNRMSRRQLQKCLKDPRILHSEFWEIPTNHVERCEVGGSSSKNRYRTVLPNESTRVHLLTNELNEGYINANYIRGYDGEDSAYIATQGPLPNTVADLWSMVLQERSPALVMITRLKEKGRVKCEAYIPTYSATYGNVQVTVKQVIQKSGYTIRQIHLQRGKESHETLHFWYTAWPDHKTPNNPQQLLDMAVEVEATRKKGYSSGRNPVIVHCSAGIGRTGCLIAISIAINQLLEENCVDILGVVCQMRLDRGGMVQTAEQYEFIHQTVKLFENTLPSVK